eukprot:gene18163-18409_t
MRPLPFCDKGQFLLVVLTGGEGAGAQVGRIWLVGAGPGDPDLLTLKAARLLSGADVVVHDRLVGRGVLDLIRPEARRLYVGKQRSHHSVPQDEVNRLLVALAQQGLEVVRLKGGDPFLFGRGGEEMLAAREAGVPCHVVPGVSAAMAASASVGAPLTHRGLAQAVTFVTGHPARDGSLDLDWSALARANQTVAIYMGLSSAPEISARLIGAGREAGTPVVIVENASRAEERRALSTLGALPAAAQAFSGPVMLLIGETAGLALLQDVRSFAGNALTANDLLTGEVVFRAMEGWTPRFADAQLFGDPLDARAELDLAVLETVRLADPYLIDVTLTDGLPSPTSFRERIRALGPTVREDLGPQTEGGPLVDVLRHSHAAARSSGRLGLIRKR